jgi:hypothetical protein
MDAILDKIQQLLPRMSLQTHVLHLATDGEILPHVDNLDASGSIILGVSLGSPRLLRLEIDSGEVYEHLLEPGSCYIQRYANSLRYRDCRSSHPLRWLQRFNPLRLQAFHSQNRYTQRHSPTGWPETEHHDASKGHNYLPIV